MFRDATRFHKFILITFAILAVASICTPIITSFIPPMHTLFEIKCDLKFKWERMEGSDRYSVEFYGTLTNTSAHNIRDCRIEIYVETDNADDRSYDFWLKGGFVAAKSDKQVSYTIDATYKPISVKMGLIRDGEFTTWDKTLFICIGIFVFNIIFTFGSTAIYNKVTRPHRH